MQLSERLGGENTMNLMKPVKGLVRTVTLACSFVRCILGKTEFRGGGEWAKWNVRGVSKVSIK